MFPGLPQWLASGRVRRTIDEGMKALLSMTEAQGISFGSTDEVALQDSHLAHLQDELQIAMEDERYADASRVKKEINMMLLPSQQSQRNLEERQVLEMAQQMQLAVTRPESVLAKLARQSWHRSIANCEDIQFVPTTPQKIRVIAHANGMPPAATAAAADAEVDTLTKRGGCVVVHDALVRNLAHNLHACDEQDLAAASFDSSMQELHLCLAASPVRLTRAAECALHMIELVGETEGPDSEAQVEIAGSCIEKVARAARLEIAALAALCPLNHAWRSHFLSALSLCKLCEDIGAEDEGWGAVGALVEKWFENIAAQAVERAAVMQQAVGIAGERGSRLFFCVFFCIFFYQNLYSAACLFLSILQSV